MRALLGACTVLALCLSSCVSYPVGRDVVSHVEIEASRESSDYDADDILEGLATSESPRFLGIWEGVFFDYQLFDENVLERDLARVERYFMGRGYYEAKVTAARVIHFDERHVRVYIHVEPGSPVLLSSVARPAGIGTLPFEVAKAVLAAMRLKAGEPFNEADFEDTKKAMHTALREQGYAFAKVEGKATVDVARHRASVGYEVTPGPRARFGPIRIKGLSELPRSVVRANLLIDEGDQYSLSDLADARNALNSLGVFASVEVEEDKSRPESAVVPITFAVQETTLRSVRLGGGTELDVLRVALHLRTGWEDKNFLGGMRRFSIEERPGVSLFPMRIDHLVAPKRVLPENRLSVSLRQPSFLEGRTTGVVAGEYNVFPLLYRLPEGVDPRSERVVGYNELQGRVGLERLLAGHRVLVAPSYQFVGRYPFMYQGDRPAGLEAERATFPELLTTLDLRDDPIQTRQGLYLSNSIQFAHAGLSGTIYDLRLRPEARFYLPLGRAKRIVLALRTGFGFLFPQNYGDTLTGESALADDSPEVIRDQHKVLLRAFYSGGPNSNRGYPLRGVGPQGPIFFLVPTGFDCSLPRDAQGNLVPGGEDDLPPGCIRPLGGLTLWEASLELRFSISGPLGIVLFADASDVTRSVGEIGLNSPHLSLGPGLRYFSPIGPIRADLGFRVPGFQVIGTKGSEIPREEGQAGTILGMPVALHLAIGEAF